MQHNSCGKCCVGNVVYNEKGGKTKNAEINNVVYMELYLGAKMVNEKYLKTKYVRSKNRASSLYITIKSATHSNNLSLVLLK
jgi:hypothetical protein